MAATVLLIAASARAQDTVVTISPVDQAVALRDSGKFAPAAQMLREILSREPDNGDAARHLAKTLYWMRDDTAAIQLYEASLARHPEDTELRLDYARMLVETRSDLRATQILVPLLELPVTRARAATLFGTMHYWRGDFATATRYFREAVATDTASADAARQLAEIRAASSPWIRMRSGGASDDQPLDLLHADIEAGAFIDPLLAVSARFRPMHFTISDTESSTILSGEAGLSHYAPSARLETRLKGGIVHRPEGDDWTAMGSLRFRLPRHLSLEGKAERTAYLSTVSSIAEPLMPWSGRAAITLDDPKGWLGEAAFRVEQFPDDNSVSSAYIWALAPIVDDSRARISFGYSFAAQDSKQSRFATDGFVGLYDPYYTPESIISHSALASFVLRPAAATTFSARGSFGFKASEDAPSLTVAGEFVDRDFTPWGAHLSVDTRISEGVSLSANVERMKTAFYAVTSATVSISYRFLPRDME